MVMLLGVSASESEHFMDRIMTALRRQRIKSRGGTGMRLAGLLCALLLGTVQTMRADNVTERVVTDPYSGLAISGFDPVAYFTDGKPQLGSGDFEYRAEGVIWRFRNEGNRAAFAADTHVYRPRFGGYDPVAIGRGVPTPGHPQIWAISGSRLYFFYDVQSRARFLSNPNEAIRLADEKWAEVLPLLTP
jgi:hypothetical protein